MKVSELLYITVDGVVLSIEIDAHRNLADNPDEASTPRGFV